MTLKILPGPRRFQRAPSFSHSMAPAFSCFSRQFCAAPESHLAHTSVHLPTSCASLRTSRTLTARYQHSWRFFRALGDSVFSALGSHRRNPISRRRREPAKIGKSPEGLSKSISRSFLGIFLRYVLGSLRDVKTYFEQKRFLVQNFKRE